ncbi:MAG: hypothetical protein K0R31_2200 [Clostridiales bacterium]|jgi:hypothetical protein|nr:hypothetical protein [Clostridiales bacterium]
MSKLEEMVRDYQIPKIARVKQIFDNAVLENPETKLTELLEAKELSIKKGDRIAITGGSRGIAEYQLVMRTVVSFVKEKGGVPFIVPAMGSHGGGTAEGQEAMLKSLCITEETVGAPIISSMEVVEAGETELGLPVYIDKNASEADGIILLNRVKTHTSIVGKYHSGLVKMLAIGLAKHKGAALTHSLGTVNLGANVERVGTLALEKLKVVCGIALIENSYEQVADLYVLKKEEILETEPAILARAQTMIPRILLDKIDCLVVYEQGKDIAGTGMDPAIIGRPMNKYRTDGPEVDAIGVLRLTKKSGGNASGCGLAEFITSELREDIKEEYTAVNCLTGSQPRAARIPITLETDKLVFQACIKYGGQRYTEDTKLVIIRNTKKLDEVYMSKAAVEAIKKTEMIEICSDFQEVPFDENGKLMLF